MRLFHTRTRRSRWKGGLVAVVVGLGCLNGRGVSAQQQTVGVVEVTVTVPGPSLGPTTERRTVTKKELTTSTRYSTTTPPILLSTLTPPALPWTFTTPPAALPPLPTTSSPLHPSLGSAPYCADASYALCPPSLLSGCCPSNYLCASNSCIPPSPIPTVVTRVCSSSHTLCPATAGFGCCPDGAICAVSGCAFPTSTSIILSTLVSISLITKSPDVPSLLPESFYDTAKRPAVTPPGAIKSRKLPNLAIAGIAVACVLLLLTIFIAAYLVYRRFKPAKADLPDSVTPDAGAPTTNTFNPLAPPMSSIPVGGLAARRHSSRLYDPAHRLSLSASTPNLLGSVGSRGFISHSPQASGDWFSNRNSRGFGPPMSPPPTNPLPSPPFGSVAGKRRSNSALGKEGWHRSAASLDQGARVTAMQAVEMAVSGSSQGGGSSRKRAGSGGSESVMGGGGGTWGSSNGGGKKHF